AAVPSENLLDDLKTEERGLADSLRQRWPPRHQRVVGRARIVDHDVLPREDHAAADRVAYTRSIPFDRLDQDQTIRRQDGGSNLDLAGRHDQLLQSSGEVLESGDSRSVPSVPRHSRCQTVAVRYAAEASPA